MLPKALALVSTILMLMSLAFFVLGSTPLLILKHEVAMDSKVIRQVFHYTWRLTAVMAAASTLGFVIDGRPALALGPAIILGLALTLHHAFVTRMDVLRATMHDGDTQAIRRFRKLHVTGIAVNLLQLVIVVMAMTQVKL